MSETVRITILPVGKAFAVARGSLLRDALFPVGVEFPCGGRGECAGCRVRVVEGALPPTVEEELNLSDEELAAGWRLACLAHADHDMSFHLAPWEPSILTDARAARGSHREGCGIAVDVGTTTIVAQLLDLSTGEVRGVESALNAQAVHGADIMSRVGLAAGGHQQVLQDLIRSQIGAMVHTLVRSTRTAPAAVTDVVLTGNTVMHNLFSGIDCALLSHYPFLAGDLSAQRFTPSDLGWDLGTSTTVRFLPCLGGFVGSDILAGILSTGIADARDPVCLIDLGTNGEIVVAGGGKIFCCSTAAGPAFEGAGIQMGMRASTGAIAAVDLLHQRLVCTTIGGGAPRGICGSGLVDAVAALLDNGTILPGGKIADGKKFIPLAGQIGLSQGDIRELQLAKGAVAAGLAILLREAGYTHDQLTKVYLAGAFGNYIRARSARRIGMLDIPESVIVAAGNTSLHGAKEALFTDEKLITTLAARIEHIPLHARTDFQDVYIENMSFPPALQ